jgi:dTDP-4-dehydrorhamnose 3,5-epimerase
MIDGAYLLEPKYQFDSRGGFARLFCGKELTDILGARNIVQINHSITRDVGAVRGMHFQHPPATEMKFVRCMSGRVFDVVVDIRQGSPTFLQWVGEELSAEDGRLMVVPEGCAHGFQVLEGDAELIYLHTASYQPEYEGGLRYDDPVLRIIWPLEVSEMSERDKSHALLPADFAGLKIKG